MVYMLPCVLSDSIGLLLSYFFWPDSLLLGPGELRFRIYPTIVQIVGLLSLLFGLLVLDPRPTRVSVVVGPEERGALRRIGGALVIVGLALYGTAIYLVGGLSSDDFFATLDQYRTVELPLGGFWYRGLDLALIGLLILFALNTGFRRLLYGLAAVIVPIVGASNKGGLEKAIVFAIFVFGVYQRKKFTRFLHRKSTWTVILPTALLCAVLVIGLKARYVHTERGSGDALKNGISVITDRYSSNGLYRGYCTLVNTLHQGYIQTFQGRVLEYTLVDWLPHMFYPQKPDHPFRAIGYMIYADRHAYSTDHAAPTLVGWAYTDGGLSTTIIYLFVGGLLLAILRKIAIRRGQNLYLYLFYVLFCLLGGCTMESGFLNFFYCIAFAVGITLPVTALAYVVGAAGERKIAYVKGRVLTSGPLLQRMPN